MDTWYQDRVSNAVMQMHRPEWQYLGSSQMPEVFKRMGQEMGIPEARLVAFSEDCYREFFEKIG